MPDRNHGAFRMTIAFRRRLFLCLLAVSICLGGRCTMAVAADTPYAKGDTWQATMLATRERLLGADVQNRPAVVASLWERLEQDYPIPSDWMLQDLGQARNDWFAPDADRELEKKLIAAVVKELGDPAELVQKLAALAAENPPRKDRRWLDLYVQACQQRRAKRLATVLQAAPKLVFTKHYNLAGSHYAYTEAQSDAQAERHYRPRASLCLLEMDGIYGRETTLLDDPEGVIRDPAVSYDGRRVLFAWKKSDRLDDYHLYELEAASGQIRQLTAGLGFADYEENVSAHRRHPVQLHPMRANGRLLVDRGEQPLHVRQGRPLLAWLTFDQVTPTTRRCSTTAGLSIPAGIQRPRPDLPAAVVPDESGRHEPDRVLWEQLVLPHEHPPCPGIPGTQKVAIASGHHSSQAGKLVIIDPLRGRQENQGCS